MATLTEQIIDRNTNGLLMNLGSATSGGDEFTNTGVEFIILANVSGGSLTVTFATEKIVDGITLGDLTVVVANTETRLVGPFSKDVYNDTSDIIKITYSGVTTLTVGLFSLSLSGS